MTGHEYLFDVSRHGWLTYAPHDPSRLRLPTLHEDTLLWAGVVPAAARPAYDGIPEEIVASWPTRPPQPPVEGRHPIATLIEHGLPDEVPDALAYHLAVNHARYGIERPVAGLPARFARLVVERGRFQLDARHRGAALYMQWLAESHQGHPLLAGFDTMVRERILEISFEAARLCFFALGECRIDRPEDGVDLWAELACYLFWVGRVGAGTYHELAGLRADALDRDAQFHELPVAELVDRLAGWRAAIPIGRRYAKAVPTP